jgi:VIT1/CCC1 family predicted Fe2+/Mn2+ transporter
MAKLTPKAHQNEAHSSRIGPKLNRLRAAVLGANDGIVSISGLVVGVAGATTNSSIIFTAGLAGLIAAALSMAAGEYVSVSSQLDTEKALLDKERYELKNYPEQELEELVGLYQQKGLSRHTAQQVAKELTDNDVHAAHFDAELGIDPSQLTSPWQAAIASAIAFTLGAALPLLTITLFPASTRVLATFVIVIVALAITGFVSARIGGANPLKASVRVVIGGALAMAITYGVGSLFNVTTT